MRRILLYCSLPTLLLTACNDSAPGGANGANNLVDDPAVDGGFDGADSGTDAGDTTTGEDPVVAEPVSLVLTLDPELAVYRGGESVTVLAQSVDADGNVVDQEVVIGVLSADPKEGFTTKDDTVKFAQSGTYTVTATAKSDESLSGTTTLTVDADPPVISISEPKRGATRTLEPGTLVVGQVTDVAGSVKALRLAGEEIEFGADGSFSFEWPLEYAVNLLALEAEDEAGNTAGTWRSVSWSSEWHAMSPPKMEEDGVLEGLAITMTQEGVDSLAALVNTILANLDIGTLLGSNVLGEFLNCDYILSQFSFTDPETTMTLDHGELHVRMIWNDLKIRIKNSGANKGSVWQCTINDGDPDGPSWATGPLVFDADRMIVDATLKFTVGKDGPGVEVVIDSVDFENMWGIDIPVIQDIVDWAIETFVSLFEGLIEGLLNDTFQGLFNDLALNLPFELPSLGGGDPNVVNLATEIAAILVSPESLRVQMTAMAGAENPLRPHDVLGSASYAGCGPTEELPIEPLQPLLVALHDDLLNQILFSVWDGGTLNTVVDASALGDFDLESLGVKDLNAEIDSYLPLIINTCGDQPRMQIGDMRMDATLEFGGVPTHLVLWIQGDVPVELAMTVNEETGQPELGFTLGDLDGIVLEIETNEGFFEGNDEAVHTMVGSVLLPQLIDGLAGGLATFPLPEIDLGDIAPGASINLNIEKVEPKGGRIRLEGSLN